MDFGDSDGQTLFSIRVRVDSRWDQSPCYRSTAFRETDRREFAARACSPSYASTQTHVAEGRKPSG